MRHLLIAAIVAVSILGSTAAASASTLQPGEHFDKTHCKAAFDTNDWGGATVYCKAYAQDNAVDAQEDSGNARIADLITEGTAMLDVAVAYHAMDDTENAEMSKSTGLDLIQEIRGMTTNEQDTSLLNKMEDVFNRINP